MKKAHAGNSMGLSYLAEGQRFELWDSRPSTVFKTVALNHSAILPMGANTSDTVMKCLPFLSKKTQKNLFA